MKDPVFYDFRKSWHVFKIVRNISGCNLKSKIEKIDEKNLV